MSERIETIEGIFGEKIHYKDGVKIGESWEGFFPGSYDHYDAEGNRTGSSDVGLFSNYNHYDNEGRYTGYSQRGILGGMNHYDENGGYCGSSYDSLLGTITDIDE